MPDISVGEIERFLVDEAALLDEWRLAEWLRAVRRGRTLSACRRSTCGFDHRTALFLIADEPAQPRLAASASARGTTWAENPRSRTRRLVTNFRILDQSNRQPSRRPEFRRSGASSTMRRTSMSARYVDVLGAPRRRFAVPRAACHPRSSKPCGRTASELHPLTQRDGRIREVPGSC